MQLSLILNSLFFFKLIKILYFILQKKKKLNFYFIFVLILRYNFKIFKVSLFILSLIKILLDIPFNGN